MAKKRKSKAELLRESAEALYDDKYSTKLSFNNPIKSAVDGELFTQQFDKMTNEDLLYLYQSNVVDMDTILDTLVTKNSAMIWDFVHQAIKDGLTSVCYEPEDLFNEGVLAMIEAFKKWDVTLNMNVSTYIHGQIRGRMRNIAIEGHSTVRIARSKRSEEDEEKVTQQFRTITSLDNLTTDDPEADAIVDMLEDKAAVNPERMALYNDQWRTLIAVIKTALSDKEAKVLLWNFGFDIDGTRLDEPLTTSECGARLGMTRQGAYKVLQNAIRKFTGNPEMQHRLRDVYSFSLSDFA